MMMSRKFAVNILFLFILMLAIVALAESAFLFQAKKQYAADIRNTVPFEMGRLVANDFAATAEGAACRGAAFKLPPRAYDRIKTQGIGRFSTQAATPSQSLDISCMANLQDYLIRHRIKLSDKTKYYTVSLPHRAGGKVFVVPEWRLVIYSAAAPNTQYAASGASQLR